MGDQDCISCIALNWILEDEISTGAFLLKTEIVKGNLACLNILNLTIGIILKDAIFANNQAAIECSLIFFENLYSQYLEKDTLKSYDIAFEKEYVREMIRALHLKCLEGPSENSYEELGQRAGILFLKFV